MSRETMLTRATTLIRELGSEVGKDPDATPIAEGLKAAAAPGEIADAVVEGIRPSIKLHRVESLTWAAANVITAAVAAVCAAIGLEALFVGLELGGQVLFALLPLLGLPAILVFAGSHFKLLKKSQLERDERATVILTQSLLNAGVPGPISLESALYVTGLERSAVHNLLPDRAPANAAKAALAIRAGMLGTDRDTDARAWKISVGPGLIAIWVIMSFWILYFHALADGIQVLGTGP